MGLQFHLLNSFYPSHNRIHFKSQKWSKLEIASRAFPLSRESQIRLLISPKSLDLDRIIIGVPAAFSPTCSDSHIPGYISHPKLKSAGKVFVISVNDAFVMNAWGKSLDKDGSS